MEKPNRAERRKNKFGGGRSTDHGGWPTHQPNPVFGDEAPTDEAGPADKAVPGDKVTADQAVPGGKATAGAPDQDQTAETGPGTGGATEQAGRAPRHEGAHASNSTTG